MPRYVILAHDHPTLHWDFMLEQDGVLKTWRLPLPPPAEPREAFALGDHRIAYLDYEGPVSGNRGSVRRWDTGAYESLEKTATTWTVALHGARWQGIVTLTHDRDQHWTVLFKN